MNDWFRIATALPSSVMRESRYAHWCYFFCFLGQHWFVYALISFFVFKIFSFGCYETMNCNFLTGFLGAVKHCSPFGKQCVSYYCLLLSQNEAIYLHQWWWNVARSLLCQPVIKQKIYINELPSEKFMGAIQVIFHSIHFIVSHCPL